MAEQLREETQYQIDIVRGRLGDLRLTMDGEELFVTNRLLYPRTGTVLDQVRGKLPH